MNKPFKYKVYFNRNKMVSYSPRSVKTLYRVTGYDTYIFWGLLKVGTEIIDAVKVDV